MSSSRLVRGVKTRTFAIVCLLCVLGAVLFVFNGTQTKLAKVQEKMNSCCQQQESLSAQLQVIFEYKARIEKSLDKERDVHKQTKVTLEEKLKEEKLNREKDNQVANRRFEGLLEQSKTLTNQLEKLKENEKKLNSVLSSLQREVEELRKEKQELSVRKTQDLEDLKSEYLKKKDQLRALEKTNEELQSKLQPESTQKNYWEKQYSTLEHEMEKIKKELDICEESKRGDHQPKPESPNTNVGEMPKFVYAGNKVTNGSTTPGLNPEAVNNFDVSSPKPLKEIEPPVVKRPSDQSPNDQIAQPGKKPTQESVQPLALPQQQQQVQQQGGADQIPLPGNFEAHGKDPSGNTLQKPNTGNAGGQPEEVGGGLGGEPDDQGRLFAPAPDEEDNFQRQGELPRVKAGENYPHNADYERDQPEDEEDDEGEQADYDERKKEQRNIIPQPPLQNPQASNHEQGVMVNPK